MPIPITQSLSKIREAATQQEATHDRLRSFLRQVDPVLLDKMVQQLNTSISELIDCTQCGNCCRSLMINVTQPEVETLSEHLAITAQELKEKYIEESQQGQMIMNTIPCHFLAENKCTIYENRFTECREFPHLHKPGFSQRIFGTLMHYGTCPIIYNVIEALKEKLSFK